MRTRRISLSFVLMAVLVAVLRAQVEDERLLQRAAGALGVPADSIEVAAAGHRTALDGRVFDALKILSLETGATTGLYLGNDGSIADDSFFTPSDASPPSASAKISSLLSDRFARNGGAATPIVIWLSVDVSQVDFRADMDVDIEAGKSVEEARKVMRERLAASNAATVTNVAATLSSLGFPVLATDTYAPIVYSTADALQVMQLVELPIVDHVYPTLEYESELFDQVATHRFDRVHRFGVNGKGVKVALIEDGAVTNTHSDLNVVGYFNPSFINVGGHATACAGILGSRNAVFAGHARGVEIYSGNTTVLFDPNITAATSWAIGQGVDIVNMSFGGDTNGVVSSLDRFVDYQTRYTATTFIKSAGNRGVLDGDVTSPGLGWNVLTVGDVDNNVTSDWDDDAMSPTSSFRDPVSPHGDRDKPEIAAVGTNVTTTDTSNGFSALVSGTSFAAPAIAGMAACFMQVNGSLKIRPELVRAVMMAGAGHNVEGPSRMSDRDGAGAINGLQAYRIVQQRHFAYGTLLPGSFSTNGFYTYNVQLQAGDRARICLAWNSTATSNYSSDALGADFDMFVFAGANTTTGPTLTVSASYDNSFEIVEFVPPLTGTYTICINDYRFDTASEVFALAWTQHVDGRYVRFREILPDVTANDLIGPCVGNVSYQLAPFDPVNPGATVLCTASAGIDAGVSLPDGRHSFGNADFLAAFSTNPSQSTFQGALGVYSGILANEGPGLHTGYRVSLPDIPSLAGLPLYFTATTMESGHPSSIKEISIVKEVKIQSHAQNLALSDDTATMVQLPFLFPFYGQSYSTCFVGSNGNVTFGSSSTTYFESVANLTSGPPRICTFWDDLNPAIGGLVRTRQAGSEFIIEWVAVPQYGSPATEVNSAIMTLHANGRIEIEYRDCALQDAIVGVSPGGNSTATEIDISSGYQFGPYGGAVYEQFSGIGGTENFDLDVGALFYTNSFFIERRLVSFTPSSSPYFGTRYLVEVDQ